MTVEELKQKLLEIKSNRNGSAFLLEDIKNVY